MKTLPSSAYSVRSPMRQPTVVSRLFFDATGLRAGVHQHEAAGAVGVLHHARLRARLAEQRRLLVARDAGDRESGAPSSVGLAVDLARRAHLGQHRARHAEACSSSSSSQSPVWMLNSIVREALLASVTCTAPPVSFQMSQVSTVPNASSPAFAWRARPARARGSTAILVRGEIGVEHEARLAADDAVELAARLAAGRRWPAVRRSCQTMALQTGSPVARSHTHRRLALVGDADGGDVARAERSPWRAPRAATPACVDQMSLGSCSTQPGCGKICGNSFCATDDDAAGVIEDDRARAGGALVEREDVLHDERTMVCEPSVIPQERSASTVIPHERSASTVIPHERSASTVIPHERSECRDPLYGKRGRPLGGDS